MEQQPSRKCPRVYGLDYWENTVSDIRGPSVKNVGRLGLAWPEQQPY